MTPWQLPVRPFPFSWGANAAGPEQPEACAATLQLLQASCCEDNPCWGLSDILVAARRAFCDRCLTPERLQATAEAWVFTAAEDPGEDVSIRWSALVRAAASWVAANIGSEWICPCPATSSAGLHTYKHSEAALAWLDFSLLQPRAPCHCDPGRVGFLLCRKRLQGAFASSGLCFGPVFDLDESLISDDWLTTVRGWACRARPGVFCLCLHGLPLCAAPPTPPVKAKTARAHRRSLMLVQACVLLAVELWERRLPWILVLPAFHETQAATLTSLPEVAGCKQARWHLLFSSAADEVPGFLFHLPN